MERKTEQIRDVALLGHLGSGKTSLAEAMLFNGKSTSRLGKVDDGTSNMDFEPEEIKRKITINSSFHHCDWKKYYINIIDTPGDDNFISDTRFSLQAADSAIVVIDATAGVKVGTEKVWAFADEQKLSRIIFSKDGSGKFEDAGIPEDMADSAAEWREKMIENVVEVNDDLMEKYLEGGELDNQEIEKTLITGIKSGLLIPVLCGSSILNIGVSQLMNLIIQGFPSPSERAPFQGKRPGSDEVIERRLSEDEPFSALVFKTLADPFAGKLTIIKVISGSLTANSSLYNVNKDVKEKFGQIFILEGKKQQAVEKAAAGDIIAFAKLKETMTGDTLSNEGNPILYKPVEPMPAVLSYAIEAKTKGSEDKVFSSMAKLLEEDPTLRLTRDQASSEIILSGTGQIHLEATSEKLNRKYGVEVNLKPMKVPYRETIKKSVKGVIYRHKKQSGGRGQFAEGHFDISPLERGAGFEFENALVGMNVPRNFVPAVEKGLQEAIESGVLAKNPVVDLKVRFYDGKHHEVDSSEMAFKIAAIMCFKKGVQDASPILLEPIMKMDITAPEEHMGDIMGDLNSRRGRVLGMDSKGKYQVIKASE